MEIPDGTPFDSSLTIVRLCSDLAQHAETVKKRIKSDLKKQKAGFVQSRLVQGRTAPYDKDVVDPKKLWQLVESKKITLEAFLGCCSINKEELGKHLGELAIAALCTRIHYGEALYTEYKPGIEPDLDAVAKAACDALKIQVEERRLAARK